MSLSLAFMRPCYNQFASHRGIIDPLQSFDPPFSQEHHEHSPLFGGDFYHSWDLTAGELFDLSERIRTLLTERVVSSDGKFVP